jgi:hypothetical protein
VILLVALLDRLFHLLVSAFVHFQLPLFKVGLFREVVVHLLFDVFSDVLTCCSDGG